MVLTNARALDELHNNNVTAIMSVNNDEMVHVSLLDTLSTAYKNVPLSINKPPLAECYTNGGSLRSDKLDLGHLPLQSELVRSACSAFISEDDVVAAVLLGSLAAGKGDRVSDADILVFTKNNFHKSANECFSIFECDKEIFYLLDGFHNDNAYFKKYIFNDLTSIEIHCIDLRESFSISKPFKVLFDRSGIIEQRVTDEPAPKHEDFPVYTNGDEGLTWELFDCIKWMSRGNHELAKSYLKKLVDKL